MSKKKKNQSDAKSVSQPIPHQLQGVNKRKKKNKKLKTKDNKNIVQSDVLLNNKKNVKDGFKKKYNQHTTPGNTSKQSPNHKIINKKTNKKKFMEKLNVDKSNVKVLDKKNAEQTQAHGKKKKKKALKRLNVNSVNNTPDNKKDFNKQKQGKGNFEKNKKFKKFNENKVDDKAVGNKNLKQEKNENQRKTNSLFKRLNVNKLNMMLERKEKEDSKLPDKKKIEQPLSLRERMMAQLKASRFRFLNEQMYSSNSMQSKKYFQNEPEAFYAYHEGYKQQVEHWPMNPLDVIIESIKKMPKDHVIADFGCGEAKLADAVTQTVHSFDLVAVNEKVQACDMAHTPLLTGRVNVVVFCLSLMGSNLGDYLLEANRVLTPNGILKIAEVESRFDKVEEFIQTMSKYGFVNTWKDLSHNLFYFMDFRKKKDVLKKDVNKLPSLTLKPCLYKKR